MPAVSPGQHRRFCEIDEWIPTDGGDDHARFVKHLPDGRKLWTRVSHNKDEYGNDLKGVVLRQLEVDEVTFFEVLTTRQPADRPAPQTEPLPDPLPDWALEALMRKGLTEQELAGLDLTAEEVEDLANFSFTLPTNLTRNEARAELVTALEQYRAALQE